MKRFLCIFALLAAYWILMLAGCTSEQTAVKKSERIQVDILEGAEPLDNHLEPSPLLAPETWIPYREQGSGERESLANYPNPFNRDGREPKPQLA